MTSLAAARTALVTAVGAKDDYADPPGCMVFSNGTDAQGTLSGSYLWRFRVMCYVGYKADNAGADVELAAYVATKLAALQAVPYQIDGVSPVGTRQIAGGEHLTADITVSTYVTLS